jgi:hypothetical protein
MNNKSEQDIRVVVQVDDMVGDDCSDEAAIEFAGGHGKRRSRG